MKVTTTPFKDLVVLEPTIYYDNRGHFLESYQAERFASAGLPGQFTQDNQSFSHHGVIRGLHFQIEPKAQAKLIRVLQGTILDVVVDLRKDQLTFHQVYYIELSRENAKQLFVPRGFAHGFSVLSETAEILYKCDVGYAPEFERGIRYDDPQLNIDWKVGKTKQIVSAKDLKLTLLKDLGISF
jgi:dTDP-4-dehydrorhamnose 3,5-epimerase